MAMECFIGLLRSRRFFRHLSCKHVTYIRWFSKILLLPIKDKAGEVHGDVPLAVHLNCSILKYATSMSGCQDWCLKKRLDLRNPKKHPIAS